VLSPSDLARVRDTSDELREYQRGTATYARALAESIYRDLATRIDLSDDNARWREAKRVALQRMPLLNGMVPLRYGLIPTPTLRAVLSDERKLADTNADPAPGAENAL
jgi:hypothetical protein